LDDKSGVLLVVAASILGACFVGGSLLITNSINRAATEIGSVRTVLTGINSQAAGRQPSKPTVARTGRPDPSKRYEVNTKGSPARGPQSAAVSIVEFSDFQCPFCGRVSPTLDQIEDVYGDQVRIVFKHLPLSIHPKAPAAHAASEAAHQQGKFWEMHDAIFANQRELETAKFEEYALEMGLDLERYRADVASAEVKARVSQDMEEARRLGVSGTPGFFINGLFLSGAQPFDAFKKRIDAELEEKS
jgi:protein-disulfide isomerase